LGFEWFYFMGRLQGAGRDGGLRRLATHPADGLPRNRVRPGATPAGLTVDYQQRLAPTAAPRLAAVEGPALGATSELADRLYRRLRFLAAIFAGYFGVVSLLLLNQYLSGSSALVWAPSWFMTLGVTFGGAILLAAILWRRRSWTLGQLRLMELLLFGTLVAHFLSRCHFILWVAPTLGHAVDLAAQQNYTLAYRVVAGINHDVYMPWALLIIVYGIFIPNRWQRCAVVVALMALAPISLRTVAYVASGMPLDSWAIVAGTNGGFLLLIAVAIAIYGAHRIEVLQREALQARRLGQYQLNERLGAGGMGEVYLAEHVLLRRPCAIKLIRPDRAGDARFLRRFEREVKTTATLTHPNTVQVYDYGHAEDGTFYYVMEYLPGLTLEQVAAIHFLRLHPFGEKIDDPS